MVFEIWILKREGQGNSYLRRSARESLLQEKLYSTIRNKIQAYIIHNSKKGIRRDNIIWPVDTGR
jgi:hypothetical protein